MAHQIKGTRQKIIITHNPSEIDQNQLLPVRFPKLGSDDVIIPGTANLSFNTELSSKADPHRALVSNTGGAILKKSAVKFEGNEILSVDDFDAFACYSDLWKTKLQNAVRQGIVSNDGCTPNCIKLRINAKDMNTSIGQDAAIVNAYGNRFIIPLDFEMLDQLGLRTLLCYEITFNDYGRVIVSTEASSYKISDIPLKYEIVTQPDLARRVSDEYQNMALLYNRVLRHGQIRVNKSGTTWNWSFNMLCKSLKGILVLFEDERPYSQDLSKFYSPKIKKVSVIVKGKPNQLYAQGMRWFEQYDEICKYFAEGKQRHQCQ